MYKRRIPISKNDVVRNSFWLWDVIINTVSVILILTLFYLFINSVVEAANRPSTLEVKDEQTRVK